jgi:N6-L-threonylcarbamoyladenine synthase
MRYNLVLSIETSCDDTSVALVNGKNQVLKVLSFNQDDAHRPFGGVVPEIASRNHSENLLKLIDQVLKESKIEPQQIDGICVTSEPGLMGSLLVGLVTAKTLSMSWKIPFIGVNHLEGHILAPFLEDPTYSPPKWVTPFLTLTVSGGHTSLYLVEDKFKYRILGSTMDDAAGEAFDKLAKTLQIGFPGGAKVDALAKSGNKKAFSFPRPLRGQKNFDFSFSGLKTSASNIISKLDDQLEDSKPDLCASFQEAIVDSLLEPLERAAKKHKVKLITITGGVSANSRLRERAGDLAKDLNVELGVPPIRYCTDNAAMIGLAGIWRLNEGLQSQQDLTPSPRSTLEFL